MEIERGGGDVLEHCVHVDGHAIGRVFEIVHESVGFDKGRGSKATEDGDGKAGEDDAAVVAVAQDGYGVGAQTRALLSLLRSGSVRRRCCMWLDELAGLELSVKVLHHGELGLFIGRRLDDLEHLLLVIHCVLCQTEETPKSLHTPDDEDLFFELEKHTAPYNGYYHDVTSVVWNSPPPDPPSPKVETQPQLEPRPSDWRPSDGYEKLLQCVRWSYVLK